MKCEWFLNELEEVPTDGYRVTMMRERCGGCQRKRAGTWSAAECGVALEDLAVGRRALEGMAESVVTVGPWFTPGERASERREEEMEEKQSGF